MFLAHFSKNQLEKFLEFKFKSRGIANFKFFTIRIGVVKRESLHQVLALKYLIMIACLIFKAKIFKK